MRNFLKYLIALGAQGHRFESYHLDSLNPIHRESLPESFFIVFCLK